MPFEINVKPHPNQWGYSVIYFDENKIHHEICVNENTTDTEKLKIANEYLYGVDKKDDTGVTEHIKGYYDLYPDVKPVEEEGAGDGK